MSVRGALCVSLCATLGCGGLVDATDPAVGLPIQERCSNTDSDLTRTVSYKEDIVPILRGTAGPGCGCHIPSIEPNPIGFEQTGLSFETYEALRAGGVNSRSAIVVPGEPCSSFLWLKVSPGPPIGARMPYDGPPFLDATQRQLIADWIAEGARDN